MNERSELERRVADWMEHRPEHMPEATFASIIDAVGGSRQRSRWSLGAWGDSRQVVPLVAAALLTMLLVGALLAGALTDRRTVVAPTLSVAFVSQPASAAFEPLDGQIEAGLL